MFKATWLLGATLASLPLAQAADPTVELSGIQVIRQSEGSGFQALLPFNAQEVGTQLALLIRVPDATIIEVDTDASKLDAFVDNQKNNLLTSETASNNNFGPQAGLGPFPRISEDGHAALFSVAGPALPAQTATKVGAKGTLVVYTASQSKKERSKAMTLKQGMQLTLAGIEFKVTKVGTPTFGDFSTEVSLESKDVAFSKLAGIQFLDEAGEPVKSSSTGSGKFGFGDQYTFSKSFGLEESPARSSSSSPFGKI